jgi:hypothetical protein
MHREIVDEMTNVLPNATQARSIVSTLDITASLSQESIAWSNLNCGVIVETTWGSGIDEFGFENHCCLLDIRISDSKVLYVSDIVNWRIRRYSEDFRGITNYSLPAGRGDSKRFIFSIDQNHFFVMVDDNEVLVLSLDGELLNVYDLKPYKPFVPFGGIEVDRNGGFFIVFLNAESQNNFQFRLLHYVDEDNVAFLEIDNPLAEDLIHRLVIGRNERFFTSDKEGNIYDWGISSNPQLDKSGMVSFNASNSHPELEPFEYIDLIAVDLNEQYYAILRNSDDRNILILTGFVHYNNQGEIVNTGLIPDEWLNNLHPYWPQVSPDGSLFIASYDETDPTVPPRIVRCTFNENE